MSRSAATFLPSPARRILEKMLIVGSVYRRPLREPPPGGRRLLAWAGPAAAVALALWLTAPAWGAAPPAGDDVMAHLVRSEFGLDEILASGHLDGWFPRFM